MSVTKQQLVLGAGRTGCAAVKYFIRHGFDVVLYDDDVQSANVVQTTIQHPSLHVASGSLDPMLWANIDRVTVSPGIPSTHQVVLAAQAHHVPVMSDIEVFAKVAKSAIVAVTGTNGKSTVTTLIGHLLEAANYNVLLGGNLGTPVLDLLQLPKPDYYVLELSSFQLEMIGHMRLEVACLLNISEDHLDRHKSFQAYVKAKRKLYDWGDYMVYNRDDASTEPLALEKASSFGLSEGRQKEWGVVTTQDEPYLSLGATPLLGTSSLPIIGKHNWANVLAAFAVCDRLGLDRTTMLNAVMTYQGLPHRCEKVRLLQDVLWLNDSKSTNIASACAAIHGILDHIKGDVIWLGGGLAKGQQFQAMLPICEKIKHVVVFGQDARSIGDVLGEVIEVTYTRDLKDAVDFAFQHARRFDCVLLSPACASYDMFSNYAQRGEAFKKLVWSLAS